MRTMKSSWIWGLSLVLVGVGFLLNALGIPGVHDVVIKWWPAILVLIGIGELIGGNVLGAATWLIVGVVIGVVTTGLVTYSGDIWQIIWPIVLILLGLRLLVRPFKSKRAGHFHHHASAHTFAGTSAVFNGTEERIDSQDFKGSSVRAVFGGAKIDLRDAKIAPEGAVIEVSAVFGGIEILVPKRTPVIMDISSVLGGHEDKRPREEIDETLPTLTVRGEAVFGGVEIKD